MKFKFDRKYLKICLYAFCTIALLLVLSPVFFATGGFLLILLSYAILIIKILSPFFLAILIAYILSPAISGIELLLSKIFKKKPHSRGKKLFALFFVYATVVSVIAITLSFVIPGIIQNIKDLLNNWQQYQQSILNYYNDFLKAYPLFSDANVQKFITQQITAIEGDLNITVTSITTTVMSILSTIFSLVIALILSFYMLNERTKIIRSFTRLLHARLGEQRAESVQGFLNSVDRVFGRYISAKMLICVIIFVITFVAFSILGMPYGILMSAIVALSTLVPIFGPFVGAVPPIVIALLDSPRKALYAAISLLVIYLVDAYVIEPVVIGEKMGLSPFWIFLSIILGGGLFGLWGVLLAVPVAAVLKLLIVRYIKSRQQRRSSELQGEGGGPAQ